MLCKLLFNAGTHIQYSLSLSSSDKCTGNKRISGRWHFSFVVKKKASNNRTNNQYWYSDPAGRQRRMLWFCFALILQRRQQIYWVILTKQSIMSGVGVPAYMCNSKSKSTSSTDGRCWNIATISKEETLSLTKSTRTETPPVSEYCKEKYNLTEVKHRACEATK